MKRKINLRPVVIITVALILILGVTIFYKPLIGLFNKSRVVHFQSNTNLSKTVNTFDVLQKSPKITEYNVGTSTYTVVSWNEERNPVAVYLKKQTGTELIYSDLEVSPWRNGFCEFRYNYEVKDGFFYLNKNATCEDYATLTSNLYNSDGTLIATYTWSKTTYGPMKFYYQSKEGEQQMISFLMDKVCENFLFPTSTELPKANPLTKVKMTGVKIGKDFIIFKSPETFVCPQELGLENSYDVETMGNEVTVHLSTGKTLSFDIRQPSKIKFLTAN